MLRIFSKYVFFVLTLVQNVREWGSADVELDNGLRQNGDVSASFTEDRGIEKGRLK